VAVVAGVSAFAAVLGTTGSAWAADTDGTSGRACAVAADSSAPVVCFDDVADTIAYITGEPIADVAALSGDRTALESAITGHNSRVASAQASGAVTRLSGPGVASGADSLGEAKSLAATTTLAAAHSDIILGAEWANKSWTGKVAVLYAATGTGCGNGSTYGFPHTRDFGMNDNISSLSGYSSCATTIYKDSSYKGTNLTVQTETSYVGGTMNDQTSSIVFRPRS
jgi:hypothetical protein